MDPDGAERLHGAYKSHLEAFVACNARTQHVGVVEKRRSVRCRGLGKTVRRRQIGIVGDIDGGALLVLAEEVLAPSGERQRCEVDRALARKLDFDRGDEELREFRRPVQAQPRYLIPDLRVGESLS